MTLSEWQEWLQVPQTSEFFTYLKNKREVIKEEWAQALYVGDVDYETIQRNAAAIGQVTLLTDLLRLEYEELEEMKIEGKQVGN